MKTKLIAIFIITTSLVKAQNCSQTSYGSPSYIPINDLGTNIWNGFMGG